MGRLDVAGLEPVEVGKAALACRFIIVGQLPIRCGMFGIVGEDGVDPAHALGALAVVDHPAGDLEAKLVVGVLVEVALDDSQGCLIGAESRDHVARLLGLFASSLALEGLGVQVAGFGVERVELEGAVYALASLLDVASSQVDGATEAEGIGVVGLLGEHRVDVLCRPIVVPQSDE
jgi:hypothetical protein